MLAMLVVEEKECVSGNGKVAFVLDSVIVVADSLPAREVPDARRGMDALVTKDQLRFTAGEARVRGNEQRFRAGEAAGGTSLPPPPPP